MNGGVTRFKNVKTLQLLLRAGGGWEEWGGEKIKLNECQLENRNGTKCRNRYANGGVATGVGNSSGIAKLLFGLYLSFAAPSFVFAILPSIFDRRDTHLPLPACSNNPHGKVSGGRRKITGSLELKTSTS